MRVDLRKTLTKGGLNKGKKTKAKGFKVKGLGAEYDDLNERFGRKIKKNKKIY